MGKNENSHTHTLKQNANPHIYEGMVSIEIGKMQRKELADEKNGDCIQENGDMHTQNKSNQNMRQFTYVNSVTYTINIGHFALYYTHCCATCACVCVYPIGWHSRLRDICNDNVARISQWGSHECQKGAMWLWCAVLCWPKVYTQRYVRAISRSEADGKWK